MAGDIKLTDQGAVVEGTLQVQGGEVHSSGAGGYSFADRTQGPRWVLYADGGEARLFNDSTGDRLRISATSELLSQGGFAGYAFMDRTKTDQRWVWYAHEGKARLFSDGDGDGLDRLTVSRDGSVQASKVTAAILDGNFMGRSSIVIMAKDMVVNNDLTKTGGKLYSYEGGEKFSLNPDGNFKEFRIWCSSIFATNAGPTPLDLVAEIQTLRREVTALKAKVGL